MAWLIHGHVSLQHQLCCDSRCGRLTKESTEEDDREKRGQLRNTQMDFQLFILILRPLKLPSLYFRWAIWLPEYASSPLSSTPRRQYALAPSTTLSSIVREVVKRNGRPSPFVHPVTACLYPLKADHFQNYILFFKSEKEVPGMAVSRYRFPRKKAGVIPIPNYTLNILWTPYA